LSPVCSFRQREAAAHACAARSAVVLRGFRPCDELVRERGASR
jgi:hypothetical protein